MYVIRYKDFREAIDPQRRLVKLSGCNLWKAPSSEGTSDWEPDHEIRSEAIGISLFTTGTDEILHYHERTWEIYQVLEGRLKIAVKPFRLAPWEAVSLAVHDMIILTPGTFHLIDSTCLHTTHVIQTPASISDKVVIIQPNEIAAAKAALQEVD
jgi:mannose-6-phosphate isomerase-like protein (cupin superfamily)